MRRASILYFIYLFLLIVNPAGRRIQSNPAHTDKVLTAKADQCMADGKFTEAAALFAKTQRPFEDVALRFIASKQSDALKAFLTAKMQALHARDKTQLTLLSTWLVELYLTALTASKDAGDEATYARTQDEFRRFLRGERVLKSLDKPTAYDLIASHGDVDDLTFFAALTEDFERVVLHHLQSGNHAAALAQLGKQPSLELYYRFAPALMVAAPRETVAAFMERPSLDPRLLIPAFIRYQQHVAANTPGPLRLSLLLLHTTPRRLPCFPIQPKATRPSGTSSGVLETL